MENQLVQLGNLIIDVKQINYIEELKSGEDFKTMINTNHKNHYCTLSLEEIIYELPS